MSFCWDLVWEWGERVRLRLGKTRTYSTGWAASQRTAALALALSGQGKRLPGVDERSTIDLDGLVDGIL